MGSAAVISHVCLRDLFLQYRHCICGRVWSAVILGTDETKRPTNAIALCSGILVSLSLFSSVDPELTPNLLPIRAQSIIWHDEILQQLHPLHVLQQP